jgi:hypothetical protein
MSSLLPGKDDVHPHAPTEPAQEVELWWGGYAGRTMVPAFVLCALLTAAVLLLADIVWHEGIPHDIISRLALYLIVLVWAVALARWAYRATTLAYRLTTRRLLREQGFSHPAPPAIELANIRAVHVEQRWWERWVGVGRVVIELADGSAEVLPGVLNPGHLAGILRQQAEACRQGHAVSPTR